MKVTLGEIVGHLEVEEISLEEGEIIVDAFVIVRTIRPDRDHPQTTFTTTVGLGDSVTQIGVLEMVSDKVRYDARRGWSDEA